MKKLLALILALCMAASLCACGAAQSTDANPAAQADPAPAAETIKIGLVGPVTGDMAFLGESLYKLVDVLNTELEETGGINGVPVEFIVGDDAATSATATTVVQKMIDVDHVTAILGPLFTTCVLAAKPIVNEAEVFTITPTSADNGIFQDGGYVFSLDASNEVSVHLRAQYLLEEKNFKKLAILGNYNDQTLNMIELWNEFWPAGGGEIVYSSTYNSGSDDFRTELTKIKNAEPDVLWIASDSNEFQAVVRQMSELSMGDLFICTDYQAVQGDMLSVIGEVLDGRLVYAQNGVASDKATQEKYAEFCEKWAVVADGALPEAHEALLYDCAWIVLEAMRDGNATSGAALRDAILNNTDFIGVTGYPVFDSFGRSEGSSTLVEYKDGVSVTLDYKLHD